MKTPNNESTTILVVDDEEIVLSLVSDALEAEPANVYTALSAREAIGILNQQPVDLLISDIRMPEMDGLELAKQAARLRPALKTIFMTGYANLSTAKDAIHAGAIDYILKPFELKELRGAVKKALAQIQLEESQNPESHLTQLTGLRDILSHAEDPRLAAISSLHCSIMQTGSQRGCIAYRMGKNEAMQVISIDDKNSGEPTVQSCIDAEAADLILADLPQAPVRLNNPTEHPIFRKDNSKSGRLFPDWCAGSSQLLLIPISRGEIAYGVIMLVPDEEITSFDDTVIKFLLLVAGQFRTALEHLALLTEARDAYQRLREYQNQTVELERLATRNAMSAEIGHDLNNFLGIVSGNLSLIQLSLRKENPEKVKTCIAKIERAIEKMTMFTSNLMDPATASTSREIIHLEEFLYEVVEFLSPQKRFEGIEVSLPRFFESVDFEADPAQMQQVLYNLLNNAADAMKDSRNKRITASVEVDRKRGQFSIRISDTGTGFTPEDLEKTFKRQFTTKTDGHGFGLSVCKRIVEQHEGTINIESPPGQGAVVTITLPMAESSVESERLEAAVHS